MSTYVALLRAVNVGGTGKLSMADLKTLCRAAGFGQVETCLASGNVVFASDLSAAGVQAALEQRLLAHAGRPVGVFIRSAAQLAAVLADNPFADRDPRSTYAFFLHERPGADLLAAVRGQADEQIRIGRREIYVHYPAGMGRSKLRLPAAAAGTARNLNTVAKLVSLSRRTMDPK
jgi:uncharacterized protein (DUF1697 family)